MKITLKLGHTGLIGFTLRGNIFIAVGCLGFLFVCLFKYKLSSSNNIWKSQLLKSWDPDLQGLAKNSFKTAEDPEEAPLQPSTPWGHLFSKLLKFYFEGLTISVFWWWWFIILGFCLFAWGGSLEGWVVCFFSESLLS